MPTSGRHDRLPGAAPQERDHRLLAWFLLAYLPFFLNDFLLIHVTRWQEFLLVDYGTRALVLLALLAPPALRAVALRREPLTAGPLAVTLLIVGCVAFDRLVQGGLAQLLEDLLPKTRQFAFPEAPPGIKQLDLLAGVMIVALTEELLCRRCAKIVLRPYLPSDGWLIAISALMFGAMHWSHGLAGILYITLTGAVMMGVYLKVGAIWPLIVAHYLIDVIAFW